MDDNFLSDLGDQERDDENEDDEDKENEMLDWARSKKSMVVFLIDCSVPIFEPCVIKSDQFATFHLTKDSKDVDETGKIVFKNRYSFAMNEISKFCRTQVRRGTADRFGVVLFNVKGSDGSSDDGCIVLLDLNQPNVKFITALDQQTKGERDPKSSDIWFDSAGISNLQQGLEECKRLLFHDKNDKDAKKAIYIVTWLDNPLGDAKGRSDREARCLRTVQDCKESQIRVVVVPLAVNDDVVVSGTPPSPVPAELLGKAFFTGRFYEALTRAALAPAEVGEGDDPVARLVERRLSHLEQEVLGVLNPRSMAALPWVISAEPRAEVAVKLYALTMEAKVRSAVWVDQRNNKRVRVVTQRASKDTGELLLASQVERYFPYGGVEVVIDEKQLAAARVLGMDKGIHLLGFQPRSELHWEDNLRAPYFIYPDEVGRRGSAVAFTALWEAMLRQGRAAVCAMRPRANAAPRLVALVAEREKRDEEGRVVAPDGLHVVPLPFCDDVRAVPTHGGVDADPPEEAVAAAEAIMEQFELRGCRHLENPQLYRHFKNLEALSLGGTVDAEDLAAAEQALLPDSEAFEADEVRELFRSFKRAVDPDYDAKVSLSGGGGGGGGGGKRKRLETGPVDAGLASLAKEGGGLEKLTVDRLKEHCRSLGLPVSGKKADLVQRIRDRLKPD